MRIGAAALLTFLIEKTNEVLEAAEDYSLYLTNEQMTWQPDDNEWTIAQCLEHLNLYGDDYLPLFEQLIGSSKKNESTTIFKSTWLGEFYVNAVKIEGKADWDKYEVLETYDPSVKGVRNGVLNEFILQQKKLLTILSSASEVSLKKNKINAPNKGWFKISLGDGLRWLVYHNLRHIFQSNQIFKALRG